jgi:alpha-ribazole phosphatase
MILDLMRHGSTGRAGHLDGRTDPALLPDAAQSLVQRYAGRRWERIVSSPRRRAFESASALAGNAPVSVMAQWSELDFGQWDGCRGSEVPGELLANFHRDPESSPLPGSEAWSDFRARIGLALHTLLQSQPLTPTLVVTHAGAMRMALHCACGWSLAQGWSLRLDYGTRLRLRLGRADDGALWGELLELEQP